MKQAERDYSHRTLFEKLGVKADSHVALIGEHEAAFVAELETRLAKSASQTLRTSYDLIFLGADSPRDLDRIPDAAEHLKPAGALWVFHPKGRGASPNDAETRAAGLAAGLVDNKICAYGETHTAIRFVIPLSRRGG